MKTAISKDGTKIAYDQLGKGPSLILVDGALCYRDMGPMRKLAPLLAEHFTVFMYDRRGRGRSTDTKPYAVEREIEDLEALVKKAGGTAFIYGLSSGAALTLDASQQLKGIKKMALYEAPFVVDDSGPARPEGLTGEMDDLLAANRRGDAVRLFMKTVGVPTIFIFFMRFTPSWSKLKVVAHTLSYDFKILRDTGSGKPLSKTRWAKAKIPALVMDGDKGPVWMRHAMKSLAAVLPNAKYKTLEGQTHMVKPEMIAPELIKFFKA